MRLPTAAANPLPETPPRPGRRRFLAFLASSAWASTLADTPKLRPLKFRISPEGWGDAQPREVEALLQSAAAVLWQHFPDRDSPRFVVVRGHQGPIVHFKKNAIGESVMELDTGDRYWAQFSYQFGHEFCHILANFDNDWKGNLWFEEMLCETASLFTLRKLAKAWEEAPPFPHWKSFAPAFNRYSDDVMKSRESLSLTGIADYYKKHAAALQADATQRPINGAMAAALLPLFEAAPLHWEAITWLNSKPSPPGETFSEYLEKWATASPNRHQTFIRQIRKLFQG